MHGGDGGATAVLVRCYGGHGGVAAVLRRCCGGAAAVLRRCCGGNGGAAAILTLAQPAVALRKFCTCSKFPPCHSEGPRCCQFSAVLRRSMTEPLRNHCDHGGATTVYAVQVPQWHRASGVTGVEGPRL